MWAANHAFDYLGTKSGLDAQVLELADNPGDALNADLNNNLLIVTLLLGITVSISVPLPEPCDSVNIFETCEANEVALEVHRTAAMVHTFKCFA